MIPSCFSSISCKSHDQIPRSLITTIYQTQLFNSPTYLTLTWSKTLHSHSLTIHSTDHSFSITLSLHPSKLSLFRSRPASKCISLSHHQHHRVKLLWDFTRAKFPRNSAEPKSGFYLAISSNSCIEFLLGDLQNDAFRRTGATQIRQSTVVSRREHVFGGRSYSTRAEFLGSNHEIGIDCSAGEMKVKVNGEVGLVVKSLGWKFRGNERIMIGGSDVELYWDVYNWFGGGGGHGVFVFQVGDGGVWPEMAGEEKRLMRKITMLSSPSSSKVSSWSPSPSPSPSRSSSSTRSSGSGGFSLLLYAWRSD